MNGQQRDLHKQYLNLVRALRNLSVDAEILGRNGEAADLQEMAIHIGDHIMPPLDEAAREGGDA